MMPGSQTSTRVLSAMPEALSASARYQLEKLGVSVHSGQAVTTSSITHQKADDWFKGECKAIVVEPDNALQARVAGTLTSRGWVVGEAHSGEQALEQLGSRSYDVVVADVEMPCCDGVAMKACSRRCSTGRVAAWSR